MKLNYNQQIYLHIMTIFFVLFGALDTVVRQFVNTSLLDMIPNYVIKMGFTVVMALSLFYHFFNKYTYLPFLNYTVLPYSLLKIDTVTDDTTSNNQSSQSLSVNVEIPLDQQFIAIVYWASQEKTNESILNNWDIAYGDFANGGVKMIDPKSSTITVRIKCPKQYTVPSLFKTKILPQHIHYRFVTKDGMMSRVFTQNVMC